MIREYKVLIVEDHPLICEAYKSALSHVSSTEQDIAFKIEEANNLDDAVEKIEAATKNEGFDLVFLDIRLPQSTNNKILSGEDLGVLVRKQLPETKVIMSTSFNDNFRIHTILRNINPDGFLIKNDIVPKELVLAINTVINDPPYYSQTIIKLLRKQVTMDYTIDKTDRLLLHELSEGTKTKDLPGILHLSIAGVEKRKRQLKMMFDLQSESDKELVAVAKEKGFI